MNDNQTKPELWKEHLQNQKNSGLSVRAWCSENQISQPQFYYWKRKLSQQKRVRPCVQLRGYNPTGGNPVK